MPIYIVNPVIVQAIKCLNDVEHIVTPLNLGSQKYLFLPINDSNSVNLEESGSHWSLLVYIQSRNKFFHFDSIENHNITAARAVADKLNILSGMAGENVQLEPCKTPQQYNSVDCGIYMIIIAEILIHRLVNAPNNGLSLELPSIDEVVIWTKRSQLASLVLTSQNLYTQPERVASTMLESTYKLTFVNKENNKTSEHLVTYQGKIKCLEERINYLNLEMAAIDAMGIRKGTTYNQAQGFKRGEEDVTLIKIHSQKKTYNRSINLKLQSITNSRNSTPRINLSCDSQGRQLSSFLMDQTHRFQICNNVKPGAPLEHVFTSIIKATNFNTYSKNDFQIVIGGTNNILNCTGGINGRPVNQLTNFLESNAAQFKHTNLILATIPYRYDRKEDSWENQLIRDVNSSVRNLAYMNSHIHLLDLYLLQSCHHTSHGLHINNRGKKAVSKEIIKIINRVLEKQEEAKQKFTTGAQLENVNLATPQSPSSAVLDMQLSEQLEPVALAEQDVGLDYLQLHNNSVTNMSVLSNMSTPKLPDMTHYSTEDSFHGFSTPSTNELDTLKNLLLEDVKAQT